MMIMMVHLICLSNLLELFFCARRLVLGEERTHKVCLLDLYRLTSGPKILLTRIRYFLVSITNIAYNVFLGICEKNQFAITIFFISDVVCFVTRWPAVL